MGKRKIGKGALSRDYFSEGKREFIKKFVLGSGALWLLKYFPLLPSCAENNKTTVSRKLFPLSVVSADVTDSSAWLWTKIKPAEDKKSVPLVLEVSEDENFSHVSKRKIVQATKDFNYTVRVKVDSLVEGKRYFFRFVYENFSSPVGTFRTLRKKPEKLRFAVVSCQDYTNGFYSAYYHLAGEDIDFVIHLGDYIYEMIHEPGFQEKQLRTIKLPTVDEGGRNYAYYLEDYRYLWEVYRSDLELQRVHERFPFYFVWDDHEFANDCAGAFSPDNGIEIAGDMFQPERRRWANRAFFEYVPGEFFYDPEEPDPVKQIKIWRKFRFGSLAELILTDERLYRTLHICGEGRMGQRYLIRWSEKCKNPKLQTMLGEEQLSWFLSSLKTAEESGVIWKLHGNEVHMVQMKTNDAERFEDAVFFLVDQWDGFPEERRKILSFIRENRIENFLVLTGDLHTFVAGELHEDFFRPLEKPAGVEFVTTSITSESTTGILANLLGISGEEPIKRLEKEFILDKNPHISFVDSRHHGYTLVELTPEEAVVEFWAVSSIDTPYVERTEKILLRRYRVKKGTNKIEDITPPR